MLIFTGQNKRNPVMGQALESRRDRFQPHRLRGILHGDEDADGRLLAVHDMAEVPELRHGDAARLHRDDDRLELADAVALENDLAVNALVRALLALDSS